jgi:hypothetical protein
VSESSNRTVSGLNWDWIRPLFVDILPHFERIRAFSRFPKNWQAIFNISIRQSINKIPNALKINFMSGLLYLIAVILLIGWLLGVFVYSVGGLIHILIVLAVISLILGIIRRA